jgi:CRP-like cAMP-binding protein
MESQVTMYALVTSLAERPVAGYFTYRVVFLGIFQQPCHRQMGVLTKNLKEGLRINGRVFTFRVTRQDLRRAMKGAPGRHLTDAEFQAVCDALRRIAPLSDDDLCALLTDTRSKTLKSGETFLKAGELASTTALVMSGGLREYYVLVDGAERTKSFNLPGELTGSLADLLSQQPSRVWISAEQPSVLLCTPWSTYRKMVQERPAWQVFSRCLTESLLQLKVEREYELLALNAAQRYQRALLRWPTLESVYSQKHIASYIGVTAVHLSRVRSGIHAL